MSLFDPNVWAWPQWTAIILWIVHLATAAMLSGKPRTGEHSFPVAFVGALISLFILTMGGFYGAAQ